MRLQLANNATARYFPITLQAGYLTKQGAKWGTQRARQNQVIQSATGSLGNPSPWTLLHGQEIVIDLASPFVYLGRLVGEGGGFVELEGVDVHDLRDTSTTRERYILDCRLHGVRPNRHRVWVRLADVVGVSRLADVVVE